MPINIKFEDLDYQMDAVNAAADLFIGQQKEEINFSLGSLDSQQSFSNTGTGVGNHLNIDNTDILNNLNAVQQRNGIRPSKDLALDPYPEFEVDMETGTGKTYIYIKTIFELCKRYGFKKFIVVVPSIPIKEGAYKNFQITREAIKRDYSNPIYNFCIYDSTKPDQIKSFASSNNIEIMIITIQAFNRSFLDTSTNNAANIIHREHDKLNGEKGIDIIAKTNPIVIIDEPQSVDTTTRSKIAITSLNPTCTFRYSATHLKTSNLIYKLDAVDAYEQELVKQIEVTSFHTSDDFVAPYIKLISTSSTKSGISALVEIDKKQKSGIARKTIKIEKGSDIEKLSGNRDTYSGYIADNIVHNKGISFTLRADIIGINKHIGGIPENKLKNMQIEATIRSHLDKELFLNDKGIKVLSLFFIDRVANYRDYDQEGNAKKGKYALEFEKLYKSIIKESEYKDLLSINDDVREIHGGYFSADKSAKKRGQFIDTSGELAADNDTYELIMKDKERLLSFDTSLRFIFSHTALREGWDNPNVFQICTLNETHSQIKKRQEIGRGLRLCVDQKGIRQRGFDINTLTIAANESYDEFAKSLQKEYEEDSGIKFGYIMPETFSNLVVEKDGTSNILGFDASNIIYNFFMEKGYISKKGKILSSLIAVVESGNVLVPDLFIDSKAEIIKRIKRSMKGISIKASKDKMEVEINEEIFTSTQFSELWKRIRQKSKYSVSFDSEKLIEKCVEDIKKYMVDIKPKVGKISAFLEMGEGGVKGKDITEINKVVDKVVDKSLLPDIVAELQSATDLTKKTIAEILIKSGTIDLFVKNPQVYIRLATSIINNAKNIFIIDGTKYTPLENKMAYKRENFRKQKVFGYINENMVRSHKSIYSFVVYDSSVEKEFALHLDGDPRIKAYVKLPSWYEIDTPMGAYNPDWAVVSEKDGKLKFFIVETKGSINQLDLRSSESSKMDYGEKHFKDLKNGVVYLRADSYSLFENSL